MIINVTPKQFLRSHPLLPVDKTQGIFFSGRLKEFPNDFLVYEKLSQSELDLTPDSISIDFRPVTYHDCKVREYCDTSLGSAEELEEREFSPSGYIQGKCGVSTLEDMNRWGLDRILVGDDSHEPHTSSEINFTAPESKHCRRLIYEYLQEEYCFLKVATVTSADRSESRVFSVTPDKSLLPLLNAGFVPTDLVKLYRFIGNGPSHQDAKHGLMIGEGLSKEQRTAVYRLLSSLCPRMDAKTVDIPNGVNTDLLLYLLLLLLLLLLYVLLLLLSLLLLYLLLLLYCLYIYCYYINGFLHV